MNEENDNRRNFTRIDSSFHADAVTENGVRLRCSTRDISYRGIFLITDHALELGDKLDVTIWLANRGSGIGLRVVGAVTRKTPEGAGLQICEIAHESFVHLRRLITFNADNPDEAEEEIRSDLGLGEAG